MKSKMQKLTALSNRIIINLALWHMDFTLVIQHCLKTFILTMRDGQTRKQFQEMGNTTYFQLLFMKLVIALDSFTIQKTKTVLCNLIYKPGFSVGNRHEIHSETDIKTVQEMHGAAKHVIVTAIFNSNKAKVMVLVLSPVVSLHSKKLLR